MRLDLAKYRETFFAEAAEHVAAFEGALLRLDAYPDDVEALASALRAAHSLKGGSDAVGLPDIAKFTHALEDVLDRFRSPPAPVPRADLDLLLGSLDVLAQLIDAAKTGAPAPNEANEMIAQLAATRAPVAEYAVRVVPHPDAFRSGLDPLPLLSELTELGEYVRTVLDVGELPGLERLIPERCYLAWTVYLRTARSPAELEAVFAFARDNIRVTVERTGPTGTPTTSVPVSPPTTATPAKPATPPAAPSETPKPPSGMRTAVPPPSLERAGLVSDFCTEAADHLEAADRCLLTLDGNPTDREALNAIYRAFHSIKGVSSMLGLKAVQTLAHEAENLLNLARDGKIQLRGPALDLVFSSTDTLKRQMVLARDWAIGRVPLPPDPAIPPLLEALRKACEGGEVQTPSPSQNPMAEPKPPTPEVTPAPAPVVVAPTSITPSPSPAASIPAAPTPSPPDAAKGRPVDKETVRVDKDRLDKLINAIGELVIAQSMAQEEFNELTRRTGGHSRSLQDLSKISRDLQELSLSLRMVPLQGTFQKLTRLVRDLSKKIGKPVELELHGEETELDKTVVDQLGDPLMHMVRNAVDHGLETAEQREAVGKPVTGKVTLRAYHQGGNVYIELSDDGRGLDRDRILAKAIEKGLVTESQRLTDSEIYALIFAPGFSTAKIVTDVSGRGVGMDVVRRNVEALQGNILIRTQLGKGTTFTVRLPLTLAIMDGLVVGLGEEVYVLPLLSVVESFRPKPHELRTVIGRGEVVNVRGEVVPLLRLHQLLGRASNVTDPCRGLVVLVEDQGKKHALLVDELLGQMQAVVKSLDANYRRIEGLAGATILGDGRVAMILDIHGLIQLHTQFGARTLSTLSVAGRDRSLGDTL